GPIGQTGRPEGEGRVDRGRVRRPKGEDPRLGGLCPLLHSWNQSGIEGRFCSRTMEFGATSARGKGGLTRATPPKGPRRRAAIGHRWTENDLRNCCLRCSAFSPCPHNLRGL